MPDVTQILAQIEQGNAAAADQLLPLVYGELRKLAAAKLANEKPGQTLQATALVHDAYIRLVDVEKAQHWNSRGHFFGAAAEAMRRILIDEARKRNRKKRGGGAKREPIDVEELAIEVPIDELLQIHEVLDELEKVDGQAAALVKLRYFAGFGTEDAAKALQISTRTAYRDWQFARAWLRNRIKGQ